MRIGILLISIILSINLLSQEIITKDNITAPEGLKIKILIPSNPVRNQGKAGTCWSYATTSFLESEIIKEQGKSPDISEMYFVFHAYINKAKNYIRRHGAANFSQGGQAHDVTDVIKTNGIVLESQYTGINYVTEDKIHRHYEMEGVLKACVDFYAKNKKLSEKYPDVIGSILAQYMGTPPQEVNFNEKKINPKALAKELNIDSNNYIELCSFNHQPYNKYFNLEIPDNWSGAQYLNISQENMIETINHALKNGYSIVWDGDVSEDDFNHKKGMATIAKYDTLDNKRTEIPVEEFQKSFNSFETTDDHLMHLIGVAKDDKGRLFYIIKNSWGTESNDFGGLLYMSENYLKLKTIAIMINKAGVPENIIPKN